MGNKQSSGKKSLSRSTKTGHPSQENLQSNLVKKTTKASDEYKLSEDNLRDEFKASIIKKGRYTKTAQRNSESSNVAIKLFDGKSLKNSSHNFETEAAILQKLDHPNIVKLFEMTKLNNQMSLVLELCDGGNVLERLPYTEDRASRIVRQVCSAVSYMHSKNIVHRDIDCSNIIFASGGEKSEVKLVDFGSACELETIPEHPGAFKFLKEKTGSLNIMAPEVILGKYGPKVDMWSVGIVTYTLLNNGKKPFTGETLEELEPKILRGYIDYTDWECSKISKDFCLKTCSVNSKDRLTAFSSLYHPWIAAEQKTVFQVLPVELVTSMSFYRTALPLKRIALNVLARRVKSSKYREVFENINKSHSGLITKEEFMEAFKHSGNSKSELEDLYEKLDININGGITYTEFIAATLETGGELSEGQLREAFDLISSNGRYITQKDVSGIVSESLKDRNSISVAKDKLERQMNRFTKKHKKEKIHYYEFAEMFEHGFKDLRSMGTLTEMSLNEEQFKALQEDDQMRHLEAINE